MLARCARCIFGLGAALAAGCSFDNPAFVLASAAEASGPVTSDPATTREPTTAEDPTSTTTGATGDPMATTTATTATVTTTTAEVTSEGSSTEPASLCGNGKVDEDEGEECDDQNDAECEANCRRLFAGPKIYDFGPGEYWDVEAGDFNNDDLLDLVAARDNLPGAPVLHNDGGGIFASGGEFPLPFAPWILHAIALTADAGDDLVVSPLFGTKIAIKRQADGNYNGMLSYVDVPGGFPPGVQLGDVDDDGLLDLVIPVPGMAKVAVALGKDGGSFATPTSHTSGGNLRRFKLASLDANPALDLVGVYSDNLVSYFVVTYNFYGPQPTKFQYDNLDGIFTDVVVAEIGEPDGDPELILGDFKLPAVRIFQQIEGVYMEVASVPVGESPTELAVVALRGSGSPDVITLNSFSGSVSVVATIGDFQNEPVLDLKGFEDVDVVTGMAVADLDGDGFEDIAVVEPNGRVAVFRNQSGD